jgi:hypothetical protein
MFRARKVSEESVNVCELLPCERGSWGTGTVGEPTAKVTSAVGNLYLATGSEDFSRLRRFSVSYGVATSNKSDIQSHKPILVTLDTRDNILWDVTSWWLVEGYHCYLGNVQPGVFWTEGRKTRDCVSQSALWRATGVECDLRIRTVRSTCLVHIVCDLIVLIFRMMWQIILYVFCVVISRWCL